MSSVPPARTTTVASARRVRRAAVRHALRDPVYALMSHALGLLETPDLNTGHRRELHRIVNDSNDILDKLNEPLVRELSSAANSDEEPTLTGRLHDALRSRIMRIGMRAMNLRAEIDRPDLSTLLDALVSATESVETMLDPDSWAPGADRPAEIDELQPIIENVMRARQQPTDAGAGQIPGTVLVVDDAASHRELMTRYLRQRGHRVIQANNGRDALTAMRALAFDVVLMDIVMPELDGYETLRQIKQDPELSEIPVIMVSSLDPAGNVAFSIELGADDYLAKPINPPLLLARVASSIDKKRLHDLERETFERLQSEQARSGDLLLNILPAAVARRLEFGQKMIADHFDSVTVLFADLVGFTRYSSGVDARDLVPALNRVFKALDALVVEHKIEKIKTIGDAYMAVGGLPERCADHALRVARFALAAQARVGELNESGEFPLRMRIGMHSGPVTAGVIGELKFAYDIWGSTVNFASRLEASSHSGAIHMSDDTRILLGDNFEVTERGPISLKGVGEVRTWLLEQER